MIWIVWLGLLGCTDVAEEETVCVADFAVRLPTGGESRLDFCKAFSVTATYEFDPDDPPEIRSAEMWFDATTEESFECSVAIVEGAACGVGEYSIERDVTEVWMITFDCGGVPDEYEGESSASGGSVVFDSLHAGDEPGNFTGEPLLTRIAGTLDVADATGLGLVGSFDVTTEVVATDAEEGICF